MGEPGGFEREFARVEALMREWSLEEATRILEDLERRSGFPNRVRHDLSVLYAQQGFLAEALAQVEAALAIEPANRALWHHFLAIQKNNPRQPTAEEWRAMHLAYGETLRDSVDARHLEAPRAPGRRLRVGYLCPDTHLATARFVWPVLGDFDAASFDVFAYWCHTPVTAELTAAYPRTVHRSVLDLDDEAVTSMIVADAIDILVDIAGHGAGNRLPVLARRPAPMQATWLDYLATTGLDTVDFRITDAVADPEGAEAAHVERLLRMPGAQWCYRPPAAALVSTVPAVDAQPVFGSVSVPLKLSQTLLDLWARLLARVPASRLRLLGIPAGRARERISRRLGEGGIDPARIDMLPRLAQDEFMREVSGLDVVLDTYPFSGATSTLDALWSGVPVVTLAGERSHSRSTASILHALGRKQWVAHTEDEYMGIASRLALEAREPGLRERLRQELRSSALCDGPRFARAMEDVLRQGWEGLAGRSERRPREIAAEFWRGLRALDVPARERVPLGGIADVVDLARPEALEEVADGRREWLLLTHSGFRLDVASLDVPSALLQAHDALAGLGVAELPCAEPTAAGEGNVRGVELDDDAAAGRLYARVFVPRGHWRCVALAGGMLLARRSHVLRVLSSLRPVGHPFDFRCGVVRVSHRLHRVGARLGVCVGLAVADRQWSIEGAMRHASLRALEADLALPRWGQELPSARPVKAAVTSELWASVRPGLEVLCDSRN